MAVKKIPAGYGTVTPYILVNDLPAIIEFARRAFDADVKTSGPPGIPVHAEMTIGSSKVMAGDPRGHSPPLPCMLYVYVEDADAAFAKAIAAGGKQTQAVTNHFYGDRAGALTDPCGNVWWIATHVEDVAEDEIVRRMAAMKK